MSGPLPEPAEGGCMKEPCDACPFRRRSLPGWLGPWEAEDLLRQIPYIPFPCHKTIKREGLPHDDPSLRQCAGAALFLNNKLQRSRDPQMLAAQDELVGAPQEVRGAVFGTPQEFAAHHTDGKWSQWGKKEQTP